MIIEFILENWQSILITFIFGFVFFIGSLYILRYREKSVEFEKYKKAKEIVIGVLENSLINKQPISLQRIKHLINASEREQNVEIKDSPINLLEDLELRFEVSQHLDPEQQMAYIEQIEKNISNIESESIVSSVPLSFEDVYTSLKENIEAGNKDNALKDLDELSVKIRISEKIQTPFEFVIKDLMKRPEKLLAFVIIYLILALIIFIILDLPT